MFLTREEMRALDRKAIEEIGIPATVLMENAGRGAAELLLRLGVHGRVVVCCGKGNNGGDGFVLARHLRNQQIRVHVLLFASPEELSADAKLPYEVLKRSAVPIVTFDSNPFNRAQLELELATAEWVVDALFGTGLRGPLQSPHDEVIAAINASRARVLALDIPSGLDCDTGEPLGTAVRAEHTATFAAWKRGFADAKALAWLGRVHLVELGIPG